MRGKYGTPMTIHYSGERKRFIKQCIKKGSKQKPGKCEWTKYDKDGNVIDQGTYYDDATFVPKYSKARTRKKRKKTKYLNQMAKARTINEDEENIDRYIRYKKIVFRRVNGKMRKVGTEIGVGHQIKNKCFLADGTYHFVKTKSFKILEKYNKEMSLESHVTFDKKHNDIL